MKKVQKTIQDNFLPAFWSQITSEVQLGWIVIHISEVRDNPFGAFGSFYAVLQKEEENDCR